MCYVKQIALKIVKHAFPLLVKNKSEEPWHYPIPSNWLEISNLEGILEQYFVIGDKLYFRAISPTGLLECYAPKIQGLFWITPESVRISLETENDKKLEESIPKIFTVMGMIDIQAHSWESWPKSRSDK